MFPRNHWAADRPAVKQAKGGPLPFGVYLLNVADDVDNNDEDDHDLY